jgi:hypothetical protein
MQKLFRALAIAALFTAHAAAASAPIRLTNASLPISQPQLGTIGIHLAAPTLNNGLSLSPTLTPALASLQPVPQLKAPVLFASGERQRSEDGRPMPAVLPALQNLADKAQAKDTPNAPVIDRFYDNTAPAAPYDAAPEALTKDPDTNLYGVSKEQLKTIIAILKKHYGDDLLDLAAIGSRAKGKASALKHFRPPTKHSDLDLSPLLRNRVRSGPDSFAIEKEIAQAAGIPIQLHGVLSDGQTKYGDYVPFYGGGYETYESFRGGDAVRIPLDAPAAVKPVFDLKLGPQALAQQLRQHKPAELVSGSRYAPSQNIASPLDIATHALKMRAGQWKWEKGSIVVTHNGVIKDGHHRYIAAHLAGVQIPPEAFKTVYETREPFDWERMQWSIRN